MFNIITGINESQILKKHNHVNVNANLTEENVIQINGGITVNVDLSVKHITYVKKIIFAILVHAFAKIKIFTKYCRWFSDYQWTNYKRGRNKNLSKTFSKPFSKDQISVFYLPFYKLSFHYS